MIKEKYPDLDFSDINFSDMKGHEENPPVPVNAVEVMGAQGMFQGRVIMLGPSRVKNNI